METENTSAGLKLTEEEALALLGLALTSPIRLDANSEKALRKLADYCQLHLSLTSGDSSTIRERALSCELSSVGV
jgi:hypothetical protein